MFPGMNPRQMEKVMRQLGIQQEQIPASEVIIKVQGKDLVIVNPEVVKVKTPQGDSFQVTGTVEEKAAEIEISEDDVRAVVEQAGVSEEKARAAISEANGDLAEAIMQLKGNKAE